MSTPEFEGLVAVVTGAASGIGAATARLLADRGARVACLDRRVDDVPAEVPAFQADLTDDAAVRAAVRQIADRFGGLDILVNNAGIGAVGTVADNDDDEWHRVLDVNVVGAVRVTRAALPHLRRSRHAAVVNTCSVAAHIGLPQRALYSASKGALQALTLAMAADHVAEGIRFCCVNPGTVDGPWVRRLVAGSADPQAALDALCARQPNARLVTATEVAAAIAYLASPLAGATTGTVLAVDGGIQHLRLPPKPLSPTDRPNPNEET
jgi:NAD(P)-dependent dehydrogenase (short-subunit alcohol dehydrogenase family)